MHGSAPRFHLGHGEGSVPCSVSLLTSWSMVPQVAETASYSSSCACPSPPSKRLVVGAKSARYLNSTVSSLRFSPLIPKAFPLRLRHGGTYCARRTRPKVDVDANTYIVVKSALVLDKRNAIRSHIPLGPGQQGQNAPCRHARERWQSRKSKRCARLIHEAESVATSHCVLN